MGELKDKVEGSAKEAAGTVTGDDELKNKGRAQQTVGNVKGVAQDVKDKVGSAVNHASDHNDHAGHNHDSKQ